MALKVTNELVRFLDDLHEWIARGRPACEFATLEGIASGTVTYRLNCFGLEAKRAEGLVQKRTGTPYPELKAQGEFEVAEEAEKVHA